MGQTAADECPCCRNTAMKQPLPGHPGGMQGMKGMEAMPDMPQGDAGPPAPSPVPETPRPN